MITIQGVLKRGTTFHPSRKFLTIREVLWGGETFYPARELLKFRKQKLKGFTKSLKLAGLVSFPQLQVYISCKNG